MKKQQHHLITSAEISWAKWQSCIKTCRSAAWLLSIKVRAILDGKRPWTTRQTPTRLRTTRQKKTEKMPCVEKLTDHLENCPIDCLQMLNIEHDGRTSKKTNNIYCMCF